MSRRKLFTVTTPLGYEVVLTRNRWREIVRFKHPAIKGREQEVRQCLQDPEVVRASVKDPEMHLYYRSWQRAHLCVVVGSGGSNERFVVTAYLTRDVKKGGELWKK